MYWLRNVVYRVLGSAFIKLFSDGAVIVTEAKLSCCG